MKTLISVFAVLLFATSCGDIYYVEPAYDPRDLVVGSYDINEYSSTYDEYWRYGVSIYKSQYDVVIDNFYNSGLLVNAHINGNQIYIPWQSVDGYEIQGNGSIAGGSVSINYKIRDTYSPNPVWDFCNASGSR